MIFDIPIPLKENCGRWQQITVATNGTLFMLVLCTKTDPDLKTSIEDHGMPLSVITSITPMPVGISGVVNIYKNKLQESHAACTKKHLNITMTLFPKRFFPKGRQGKAQNKTLTIGY